MNDLARIRHVRVATPQGPSGDLSSGQDRYLFTCAAQAGAASEISLLMPHRAEQYASPGLHPIFQMNLPEGYVLEQLRNRIAKSTPLDPMLLFRLSPLPLLPARIASSSGASTRTRPMAASRPVKANSNMGSSGGDLAMRLRSCSST